MAYSLHNVIIRALLKKNVELNCETNVVIGHIEHNKGRVEGGMQGASLIYDILSLSRVSLKSSIAEPHKLIVLK